MSRLPGNTGGSTGAEFARGRRKCGDVTILRHLCVRSICSPGADPRPALRLLAAPPGVDPPGHLVGRSPQYRRGVAAIPAGGDCTGAGHPPAHLLLAAPRLEPALWHGCRRGACPIGFGQPAPERLCRRRRCGAVVPFGAARRRQSGRVCWRWWWAPVRPSGLPKARKRGCIPWALPCSRRPPWPFCPRGAGQRQAPRQLKPRWQTTSISSADVTSHTLARQRRPGHLSGAVGWRLCPPVGGGVVDSLQRGLHPGGLVFMVGRLGAAAAQSVAAVAHRLRLRPRHDRAGAPRRPHRLAPDSRLCQSQYHHPNRGRIPEPELAGLPRRLRLRPRPPGQSSHPLALARPAREHRRRHSGSSQRPSVTRHPSPVTRHPSPVTRHPSPPSPSSLPGCSAAWASTTWRCSTGMPSTCATAAS